MKCACNSPELAYLTHQASMLRYAARAVAGRNVSPEDCLQEAAIRAIRRYKAKYRKPACSYLWISLRSTIRNAIRAEKRRMYPIQILKTYFGLKPGQTLAQFATEIKALSAEEKSWMVAEAAKVLGVTVEEASRKES